MWITTSVKMPFSMLGVRGKTSSSRKLTHGRFSWMPSLGKAGSMIVIWFLLPKDNLQINVLFLKRQSFVFLPMGTSPRWMSRTAMGYGGTERLM